MGILGNLLFGGGATGAGKLMEGAGKLAKDIRVAITGELPPDKRAEFEAKALELEAEVTKAQLRINEAEAQHTSVFVAGWRPAVGWVCVAALAYHFILNPIIAWACAIWYPTITPPEFEMSTLTTILLGILGLSGMRSYEKSKQVDNRH